MLEDPRVDFVLRMRSARPLPGIDLTQNVLCAGLSMRHILFTKSQLHHLATIIRHHIDGTCRNRT